MARQRGISPAERKFRRARTLTFRSSREAAFTAKFCGRIELEQSRERVDNLRAQIDADIRTALLNLQSSADQVTWRAATLIWRRRRWWQSRDRFSAGVTDTVKWCNRKSGRQRPRTVHLESLQLQFCKNSLAAL